MVSDADRARLLAFARQCFEARVRGGKAPRAPQDGIFRERRGAFVTIHRRDERRDELRGCLGRISPSPLGEAIGDLAAAVADSDPRFPAVRPEEMADISLEISVLTPEEEVTDIARIEVGRHGLIVEDGMRRGLLLPQVASERHWDRETFLDQTCVKAGLRPDAWRQGARIWMFQAVVFGESES